jgi:hypothetical protein
METTSAFTTLSLLQRNPTMVALLSTDVAEFCTRFGMTCILPLQLQSRSEPYQLVMRSNNVLSPVATMFTQEFSGQAASRGGVTP